MALFERELALLHDKLADLSDEREDVIMTGREAEARVEAIDTWLKENERVVKFIELIPKAKKAEGELAYITIGQYKKHWTRTPKKSILTPDGKRVRWEYALDEFAQELGLERQYGSKADEALRDLIMLAKKYKARKADFEHSLMLAEDDIKKAEGKLEKVTIHISKRGEVADTQDDRSAHAKAIDKSKQARRVLLFPDIDRWLVRPGRYDIRGVDTVNHKPKAKRKRKARARVMPGIRMVR